MIFLNRQLPYLIDPRSGASLNLTDSGIVPEDDPSTLYPVQDGILRLNITDLSADSARHDEKHLQQGIPEPDEGAFRKLPRTPLPGWGENYWQRRALSTAAMWHVLEKQRRKVGKPGVGFQGIAADVTSGLPYMAYGLDAGGYITFAVSPNVGKFGLGIHPHSRYCRVQANWEALPLKPAHYDVVIFSGSLPDMPPEILPGVLGQAAGLLREGGVLFITDTPSVQHDSTVNILHEQGLQVDLQAAGGMADSLNGRLKHLLRKGDSAPPLLVASRMG